jgi:hypothetical protein
VASNIADPGDGHSVASDNEQNNPTAVVEGETNPPVAMHTASVDSVSTAATSSVAESYN